MTEIDLPKAPARVSREALFRHTVVARVLARVALGDVRAAIVAAIAGEVHVAETGKSRPLSARTIYRWLSAFETHGVAGLEPQKRSRKSKKPTLPAPFVAFLIAEKKADPRASIPEIIRRAQQAGALRPGERVHRATVYRRAVLLELPLTKISTKRDTDMRRFAYPHRMRMVLVDGKFFRAGLNRQKRLVFFFIDDATRYVLGVVVGTSETTILLLRGLHGVIQQYGLMDILFFDRGSGFRSDDTHAVCIKIGIRYIHGTAAYPEGHGKIERFNRTAWADCLRGLSRDEIDPAPGSLELRIRHYVDTQYNLRIHESLHNKSPQECWSSDERALRFPRDADDLRQRFIVSDSRRVSKDNVISVDGIHYEVPRGHAGTVIEVSRSTLDGQLSILREGRQVRLHPVDLAKNAEARRATARPADADEGAPNTAAARAFDRDFGPISSFTGARHTKNDSSE